MESFGNFFEEEWHSLSTMFISDEDSDLLAKQGLISSQYDLGLNFEIPNIFLSTVSDESSNAESFFVDDEHLVNVSDNINANFYQFFSQENNISGSDASNGTISLSYPYHESFPLCPSNLVSSVSSDVCDRSIESCMMNKINNSLQPTRVLSYESLHSTQDVSVENVSMGNSLVSNRETLLKRKLEMTDLPVAVDDDEVNYQKPDTKPKKRTRVSRENKNKKNVQPKKNQKTNDTEEENNNKNGGEINQQSSSSCSSNDDLNASQELNEALNQNAKTRASRGTATDPQSLYARKRRERINERLRILQNLVPNGTKVDISTMLEEAVEYVKFLKLQIQLLSSDDMWMYAPIAYNGMDMGLYQNIIPNL